MEFLEGKEGGRGELSLTIEFLAGSAGGGTGEVASFPFGVGVVPLWIEFLGGNLGLRLGMGASAGGPRLSCALNSCWRSRNVNGRSASLFIIVHN